VYEPAEDTFLLCDAVYRDRHALLRHHQPRLVLEVGSGSGCVVTFVAQLLQRGGVPAHCLALDINADATRITRRLAAHNGVAVDAVHAHFAAALGSPQMLASGVDVLLFNPPYVPTPREEVGHTGIEAAWAGGTDGREVIDEFLPLVAPSLSPGGVCYLVLVEENKPHEVAGFLRARGLYTEVTVRRRAVNEGLMVMKITKPATNAKEG
jgi:release factor glutamine methyltransferase